LSSAAWARPWSCRCGWSDARPRQLQRFVRRRSQRRLFRLLGEGFERAAPRAAVGDDAIPVAVAAALTEEASRPADAGGARHPAHLMRGIVLDQHPESGGALTAVAGVRLSDHVYTLDSVEQA